MTQFEGKLDGVVQRFSIDSSAHHPAGEEILDGNGDPVDGNRIVYPTYDPMIGLTGARASHQAGVVPEELGDLPSPALPIAYGDEEEDEPDYGQPLGNMAYATRAERQYAHVRQALRNFTPAEKDALINEGEGGTRAAHMLDLTGTHYEQMPDDDDAEWGFGL